MRKGNVPEPTPNFRRPPFRLTWSRGWWWVPVQLLAALLAIAPWPQLIYTAFLTFLLADCLFGCVVAAKNLVVLYVALVKKGLKPNHGRALALVLTTLAAIPIVTSVLTLLLAPFIGGLHSIAEGGATAAGFLAMLLMWTIPTGALLTTTVVQQWNSRRL